MGGQLVYLYSSSSRASSRIKPFTAYFSNIIRLMRDSNFKESSNGHGHGHGEEQDRAPSIAEEFKRLAEEKAKLKKLLEEKERQGFGRQAVENFQEAVEEAAMGKPSLESTVKERFKEPVGKGNFHKTGDGK